MEQKLRWQTLSVAIQAIESEMQRFSDEQKALDPDSSEGADYDELIKAWEFAAMELKDVYEAQFDPSSNMTPYSLLIDRKRKDLHDK